MIKGYVQLRRGLIEHIKIMSFSELKVYIGLLLLANFKTGCVNITVANLCDILGTDYKNTLNSIHRLAKFGYVKYTPAQNQWKDSKFEITKYKITKVLMEKSTLPVPEPVPQPVPEAVPEANAVSSNNNKGLQTPKNSEELIRREKNKEEDNFFSYYLLKTKKNFKMNDARRKLIVSRLKDYSIGDLKCAVDNFMRDTWEGRKDHLDLIYCIGVRNKVDNLEKWLNKEGGRQYV